VTSPVVSLRKRDGWPSGERCILVAPCSRRHLAVASSFFEGEERAVPDLGTDTGRQRYFRGDRIEELPFTLGTRQELRVNRAQTYKSQLRARDAKNPR